MANRSALLCVNMPQHGISSHLQFMLHSTPGAQPQTECLLYLFKFVQTSPDPHSANPVSLVSASRSYQCASQATLTRTGPDAATLASLRAVLAPVEVVLPGSAAGFQEEGPAASELLLYQVCSPVTLLRSAGSAFQLISDLVFHGCIVTAFNFSLLSQSQNFVIEYFTRSARVTILTILRIITVFRRDRQSVSSGKPWTVTF